MHLIEFYSIITTERSVNTLLDKAITELLALCGTFLIEAIIRSVFVSPILTEMLLPFHQDMEGNYIILQRMENVKWSKSF